jgi:hypothetical protein
MRDWHLRENIHGSLRPLLPWERAVRTVGGIGYLRLTRR